MIHRSRKSNNEISCEIEYDVIPERKLIFVNEIVTYKQEDRRKGFASRALYDLAKKYHYSIQSINFVGISTEKALPFWKTLGASFASERDVGDCFFELRGVDLYLYLRDKRHWKEVKD